MFNYGAAVAGPRTNQRSLLRNLSSGLLGLVWLASIFAGFWWLLSHDTDVNELATESSTVAWHLPEHLLTDFVEPNGGIHTVVSLHPKCPCTRNSLETLAKLLSDATVNARCTFLVFTPESGDGDWMETGIAKAADQFPNAKLIQDVESKKALELGLFSSGAVIVINDFGEVLFQGGVTSGRSCNADNPGALALSAILQGRRVPEISPPVFGCSLTEPDHARREI